MHNIKFIPSDFIEINNHSLMGLIKIYNSSDEKRAFKIKTTKPKDYVVKPSLGILQPGQEVLIEIKLLEGSELDDQHKYVVEIYTIGWRQTEDNLKHFLKNSNINPYTIKRFEVKYENKKEDMIKLENDKIVFYLCLIYICCVWCSIIYNIIKNKYV